MDVACACACVCVSALYTCVSVYMSFNVYMYIILSVVTGSPFVALILTLIPHQLLFHSSPPRAVNNSSKLPVQTVRRAHAQIAVTTKILLSTNNLCTSRTQSI